MRPQADRKRSLSPGLMPLLLLELQDAQAPAKRRFFFIFFWAVVFLPEDLGSVEGLGSLESWEARLKNQTGDGGCGGSTTTMQAILTLESIGRSDEAHIDLVSCMVLSLTS